MFRCSHSLLCITVVFLTGCSSNFQSFLDSAQVAFEQGETNNLPAFKASSLKYANALVTIDGSSPISMVLAFSDPSVTAHSTHKLTWLSSDSGAIVTESGRIVHTVGFQPNNLETLTSAKILPKIGTDGSWEAIYDWSPGYRYNFTAQVSSQSLGFETIKTDFWEQEAEHFIEIVEFKYLNAQFTNHFWVVKETNQLNAYVIKSIQHLGPNMNKIEMLMVKPFLEIKANDMAHTNLNEAHP